MIKISLDIKYMGFKEDIELFQVKTSIRDINEVRQAVNGEVNYNKTLFDFGGLIYE